MRMTRAASRAQAHDETPLIHEDADAQEEHEPQPTENSSRPILKDITDGNLAASEDIMVEERVVATNKSKGKRRGRQAGKKDKVKEAGHEEQRPEDGQAEAVEGVVDRAEGTWFNVPELQADGTSQEEDIVPPKTPKFDPQVHDRVGDNQGSSPTPDHDSFLDDIKTRSPSKWHRTGGYEPNSPDSFVEHITSRTPASSVPRIEDSVEAIDALEEAIEKVSETLPVIQPLGPDSPAKSRACTPARSVPVSTPKAPPSTLRKMNPTPKAPKSSPLKSPAPSMQPERPTKTKGQISSVKPALQTHTVTTHQRTKLSARHTEASVPISSKPESSFSQSPAKVQPNTVKKRALSTNKPGFVPAKSTKPVTKSSFSLPGEAVAARLKAQREERLKREEEAEKRKVFKARPAPPSASGPGARPRENKTSQARKSLFSSGPNKENVAPKPAAVEAKPRTAVTVIKTRPDPAKANSGVRRTASVSNKPNTIHGPRLSSLTSGQRLTLTKGDVVQQKARGKEVFSRTKAEIERLEKEKKEKEEAAKRARAEAAERGRQASREWAEKQKKKLAMQAAAKLAAQNEDDATKASITASSVGNPKSRGSI